MGEREGEVLGNKLLDVRALDVFGLLELDDAEDLGSLVQVILPVQMGWISNSRG